MGLFSVENEQFTLQTLFHVHHRDVSQLLEFLHKKCSFHCLFFSGGTCFVHTPLAINRVCILTSVCTNSIISVVHLILFCCTRVSITGDVGSKLPYSNKTSHFYRCFYSEMDCVLFCSQPQCQKVEVVTGQCWL